MSAVFSPLDIGGIALKNRVVMPPMVVFGLAVADGRPAGENALHYARRARGGAGLIIVEATCVHEQGKLHPGQLGLWEDGQIEGHQRIADAVHAFDCPVLVQLHHAGLGAVTPNPVTASDYEGERRGVMVRARGMSHEEVEACIGWFIDAARRAYRAGYDGVEVHAAHSYLLSQFLCADVNKRDDEYGGSVENRARIVEKIIRGVREACGDGFVIGVRMGANEPDAPTSAALALRFERAGMDFCHVSSGFHSLDNVPDPPENFAFSKRVHGAMLLREKVGVPLIAVGEVRDIATADAIIKGGIADCVAIGRGLLADEDLVYHSDRGKAGDVFTCIECPRCLWYTDGELCPMQRAKKRAAQADGSPQ